MTWAQLLSPCVFGWHGHRVRERDHTGHLVLVCELCGHPLDVLTSKVWRNGPQHHPARVPGAPTGRAKVRVDDNVVPFERQSSR